MDTNNPSPSNLELSPDIIDDIKVLVVDDQHFARKFIERTVDSDSEDDPESHLKVIGTASDGQQAVRQVEFLKPDVVIIDLEMPGMNGITATQIITQKFPDCKVLVLSSYDDASYLHHAFQAGAKGYLLKTTPKDELINAILYVNKGYYQVGPGLLAKAFSNTVEVASTESNEGILSPSETKPQKPDRERWSSSTQELLNTFPRVWSRGLVYLLVILIAVGLPWAIFSKIDETGTARGKIEPKGKTQKIDTAVSGVVTKVLAEEGQPVREGQELLEVESESVTSQLQQQQEKLAGLKNQLAQLKSLETKQLQTLKSQEQQNQAQTVEKQAQLEQARQSFESIEDMYSFQKQEKQAQLEKAQKAIATGKAAYDLAQIRLRSATEKIPRYRQAYQDGAISQDRYLETTQLAAEAAKELEKAKSELEQLQSGLKETQSSYQTLLKQETSETEQAKLRVSEQQGSYSSLLHNNNLAMLQNEEKLKDTDAKIATLEGEIAQTASQIKSLEFKLTQYKIKAPVAGTIFQFPIQNAGATVRAGDTIAAIAQFENDPASRSNLVPGNTIGTMAQYPNSESNLVLRAKMPSSETAFLKTGLPAKIKFDAYPFQDYGIVEGRVTWISPDSKVTQEAQPTQPDESSEFFELEIDLDHNQIANETKQIPITPGQTATAEIVIRQRRLIDFFLDPFQKLRKGGLEL